MRNRALQTLHTSPAASVARTFSFSSVLQAAAGRAWARRVITHAQTTPAYRELSGASSRNNNAHPLSSSQKHSKTRVRNQALQCVNIQPESSGHRLNNKSTSTANSKSKRSSPRISRGVTYTDPALVDDDDFSRMDPGFSPMSDVDSLADETGFEFSTPSSIISTPQALPIRSPSGTLLPVSSRRTLWENILYLHNSEKAGLPVLIDYHDIHPKFRSTRSYNLLIRLAIIHESLGAARWLFKAMQDDDMRPNVETWKLRFRWLVRSGWSDQAWDEFVAAMKHGSLSVDPRSPAILEICAEFCSHRSRAARGYQSNEPFHLDIPPDRTRALWERFSTVLENDIGSIHPRNIYFMILLLLKNQHSDTALSFASTYFQSLPRNLNVHTIDRCLRIIHLQIAFGSSLRGLAKLYWARKTMKSLLRCHPSLRPTSTTLFLLLSPLKQAKHCGTVAAKIVREFKRKWGPLMEDSRVRRRVVSLAVKEGRLDIVKDYSHTEYTSQRKRQRYKRGSSTLGSAEPASYKALIRISSRLGHEMSLWVKLERRARRLKFKSKK